MKARKQEKPRIIASRFLSRGLLSFSCSSALLLSCSTFAQDQPTLDELLDLAPPPTQDAPETEQERAPAQPTDEVEARLNGQQAADAFAEAVKDMSIVAERLGDERDPGLDTQRLQESILARLDQIIEAAEQQQQSSSSSGGGGGSSSNQDSSAQNAEQGQQPGGTPQPGQGQAQAQANAGGENPGGFSPGQVGAVDPGQGAIDEVRSEWGALPPRLRDELTNGLDEPYSPVYRSLTEAYYRRLAEETGR
ncbi:MAG: hypothetical protein AAGH99_02870 [Planctomycetota bacterium]